jgi:hypothetical protein
MKKLLLAAIFMVGCGAVVPTNDVSGGTICQGSKVWRLNNTCGLETNSGLCIKAVDGPIVLREIKSSQQCPHAMWVGIKDSWSVSGEATKPRWEMKSLENSYLHIKDSKIEIKAGESLFVGTMGHNWENHSSRCYVTWTENK